ncbi:MAG: site-specific integrase [Planctomycetota bacterium]|nr:site-specific integrase [Planctomycetota bacterium]
MHAEVMKDQLARSTFNLHLKAIDLLAEHVGWERPLHRISTREVEQFRAARLATGHSPSSANREVRTLKRLFNLAIVRGYLAPGQNPCLALPRIKVGRQRNAYCSPAEFQTILRAAPDGLWRAFLVLVYSTGLRLREATNLTWKDVEFQPGQVHVTRKAGGPWIQPWQPKDHEMRSVPLPEQAVSLLAAWQAVAPEGCPYVFMEHGRWEYYRRQVSEGRWRTGLDLVNNMLRRFKTLCRRAGVGPYTIHDLRRSCITNWARRLPIHVVQQLAGHSEIQTTETYYLSVHEDDLARAREVQSELVGELPEARPTDTKLTQRGPNRGFPQKKDPAESRNPLPDRGLQWRPQEESNL